MLGTDIWAANTLESVSGATWDLQPEKLDFTQFHRKLRNTPKHPLPQIDREGIGKGKGEEGDGINLNDIGKVLPTWQGCHPLPHEAEIAHTKKLFRRRRNDRRPQSSGCKHDLQDVAVSHKCETVAKSFSDFFYLF
ncbi:PREDICTED: CBP80/20-dependent translation initiation factor-like [Thamnophis sirtalis]|uniref:CBP80/20-dependent translation initiation factor-like n=1 Tax=Thamnophis sirtalis TaxID=35019 RepID=A0A6I9YPL0_9SAUR|nr:PREDICTED: CBP80/20-dependent translation initiation factor-like [Thamnophis sirtalis]